MASRHYQQVRGGYRSQRGGGRGINQPDRGYNAEGKGGPYPSTSTSQSSSSGISRVADPDVLGQSQNRRWVPRAQGPEDADGKEDSIPLTEDVEQRILGARVSISQARLRATFYPKFENEKSDREIRAKMVDVVQSENGVLEVTLKHSGSLFMYAGDSGGAFAKNSFGNLYTAVGVFVLGRTLQDAWGRQASEKQKEFNTFLEKESLCISMELVTAVLGDHGQRPLQDYVVVTAITDLKSKPRFYSTPDLIAFCRQWRLPTNHVWLFSSRKSATSFFTAHDALCEEGTASSVSKILDEIADLSVPATKSHMEVQGEILEGLVARIVSHHSTEQLKRVLIEYPIIDCHGEVQLGPSLREICATHRGSEKQQIKVLLESVGVDMCSDSSDWTSTQTNSQTNSSLLKKFLKGAPADYMTMKFQEMINLLQGRKMQVRYPCRMKELDSKESKCHFKMTVHVLNDYVFRKYQKEMRYNPGLWPLYRGFFVDVYLFYNRKAPAATSLCDQLENTLHVNNADGTTLADESENLMLKLKFLTYKIRTFLIRNGLSILFSNGFSAYRKYYLRQMEIWGTSPGKQRHLDHLLREWASYITNLPRARGISAHMYLSEAEPFLDSYAKQSTANSRLIGFAGSNIKTEDFVSSLFRENENDLEDEIHEEKPVGNAHQAPESLKRKGFLVFFPGIPGCGKSALCNELLNNPSSFSDGKPVRLLMGDLIKGRYWPKLEEQQRKNPRVIMLADKNAPNPEVWRTIKEICQRTSTIGVPVVPDSEGTDANPFSVDSLALFMNRVLMRVNHPGNLDRNSPNPGYVLLMFYNLYDGKDRREFEETLVGSFGYLIKLPLLKPNRPPLPPAVLDVIMQGLDLFKRHTEKHGRLESTKGSLWQAWSGWEKQLQEVVSTNVAYFNSVQVPFEESLQSVQAQLRSITTGETSMHVPAEEVRSFKTVSFAAITLPVKEVVDLIQKIALLNKELETYFQTKGIASSLKSVHLTLAHKASHGVPTVASYSEVSGLSVLVELTALLFCERTCALEAHILENSKGVSSRNEWPHVTIWTAQGVKAKEANSLPQLVSRGEASRVEFSKPVVMPGVVELL